MHRPHLAFTLCFDLGSQALAGVVDCLLGQYLDFVAPRELASIRATDCAVPTMDPTVDLDLLRDELRAGYVSAFEALGDQAHVSGLYGFHYLGRQHGVASSVSAVRMCFPLRMVRGDSVERFVEFVSTVSRAVPFHCGLVAVALASPRSPKQRDSGELLAHPGVDVHELTAIIDGGGRLPGASWVTLLGEPLVELLGGRAKLLRRLGSDRLSEPRLGTLLLRASKWPEIGDLFDGQHAPGLRQVAEVLAPATFEPSTIDQDPTVALRWHRRHLDPIPPIEQLDQRWCHRGLRELWHRLLADTKLVPPRNAPVPLFVWNVALSEQDPLSERAWQRILGPSKRESQMPSDFDVWQHAVDGLRAQKLIDVDDRCREDLVANLCKATGEAQTVQEASQLAVNLFMSSSLVEELYGYDSDIQAVIERAWSCDR